MNLPDLPEPCTEEAHTQGCTCSIPSATAYDTDPLNQRQTSTAPYMVGRGTLTMNASGAVMTLLPRGIKP